MATNKNTKSVGQLTAAEKRIIEVGLEISENPPTVQEAAYLARELVLCTLPHKNPGQVEAWTRRNGNLTLAMQAGYNVEKRESYGYPFGTLPRLLLYWIITEAVRTRRPRLELGASLSEFMRQLGLSSRTGRGKRGDAPRLRDQMERLFHARISFHRFSGVNGAGSHEWAYMEIAPKGELWWNTRSPEQQSLWGSWITLGADFYESIIRAPVPVDVRALRALKRSPLALDLYGWLCLEAFKAHSTGRGRFVSWPLLMEQIGADYARVDNFAGSSREALRKIEAVYPRLRLGPLRAGVRIEPESLPAILAKPPLEAK